MAKEKKSGLNEWETLARSLQEIEEKKELEETKPVKGRGRSSKKAENEVKEASEMKKPVKRARNVKTEATPEEVVEQKDLEEVAEKKVAAPKAKVKKENVAKPKKRVKKATSSKETASKETAKKTVKASAPSLDLISQITKLAESKEQEENSDSFVINKINLENDDFSLDDFFANNDEEGLEISWGRPPRAAAVDSSEEEEEDLSDLSFDKKESEASAQNDLEEDLDEEDLDEEDLDEEDSADDDLTDPDDLLSDVPEIIEQVVAADGDEVEVLISLTAVDPDDDLLSETTMVNPEHADFDREVSSRREGDSRRGRRNRGRRDRSERSAECREAGAQNADDCRNGSRNSNGPKADIKKEAVSDAADSEDRIVAEKADSPKEFSLNDFFADADENTLDIAWGKPSRFAASEKSGEIKGKVDETGLSPKKAPETASPGEKREFSGNRRDRSRDDRGDRRNNRSDRSERSGEGNNDSRDCRSNRRNDRNSEFRDGAEVRMEDRRDDSSRRSREDRSREDRPRGDRPREDRSRENRARTAADEGMSFRDREAKNAEDRIDQRENVSERRDSDRSENRRNADRRVKQGSEDRQGRSPEDRSEKSMPSWEEAISLVVKNNMARHGNRHDNNKKRR